MGDSLDFKSTLGLMFNITLRLVLLGLIIYGATTYIPSTALTTNVKITISVVVVLIYSLLDVISSYMVALKNKTCEVVCGCGTADMATQLQLN